MNADDHKARSDAIVERMPNAIRAVFDIHDCQCPRCGRWHKRRYRDHDEEEVCRACERDAAQYESAD